MQRDPSALLAQLDSIESAALLGRLGVAVVQVDADWRVRHCNGAYLALAHLPREAVIGRTPFDYHPGFARSAFYHAFERCMRLREAVVQVGHSALSEEVVHLHAFPLAEGGAAVVACRMAADSIHQNLVGERALTDSLTRLPNQQALIEDLQRHTSEKTEIRLTIVAIDRLERVQNAQGYAGVDAATLEIASRLLAESGPGESVHRLGGDEFAVVARGLADDAHARARATAFIAAVTRPLIVQGQRFLLGATAGCDRGRADGASPATRLHRAALALRHARANVRGGVVIHDDSFDALMLDRVSLESDLHAAIAADALHLEFQPKGDLRHGGVVGAEALVRWDHPGRGRLLPGQFLAVADEAGLMPDIDRLVMRQAVASIAALRRTGHALPVSINLSVHTLGDESLVADVMRLLDADGVPPGLLEIEIPEGALMADVERSVHLLGQLSARGVRASIDDFGTGYSSLSYLARLPVQALKIDRSFVGGLDAQPANLKIVRGIAQLARSMRLQVVAEGAETADEIALLRSLDCDVVQGYGYARPMPLDALGAFCQERAATRRRLPDPRSI